MSDSIGPQLEVTNVPIDQIEIDESLCHRRDFKIEPLVSSIRSNGMKYPVDALELENSHLKLIAGHRRLQAAREAEVAMIPVRIHRNLSDQDILRLKGIENEARKNLEAKEQYLYVKGCIEAGLTLDQIEETSTLSRRQAAKYSVIARSEDETIGERLVSGHLSLAQAYEEAREDTVHPFTGDSLDEVKTELDRRIRERIGQNNGFEVELSKEDAETHVVSIKGLRVANAEENLSGLSEIFRDDDLKRILVQDITEPLETHTFREPDEELRAAPQIEKIFVHAMANRDQVRRILERNPDAEVVEYREKSELPRYAEVTGHELLRNTRSVLALKNHPAKWSEEFMHVPEGTICPSFTKLNAYSGCPFKCEYCYLWLTHRNSPWSTHYVDIDRMMRHFEKLDRNLTGPKSFMAGELSDPLAFEPATGWLGEVIPRFGQMNHAQLRLLTKADCVDPLLDLPHNGKTKWSFSLNTERVWRAFEHGTASPSARIEAAKKLDEAGYQVGIRIDPNFPYDGWREDTSQLVSMIYENFEPSVITLGEYRPNNGLIGRIKTRFPETDLEFFERYMVHDAGKKRFPNPLRTEMLRHLKDVILGFQPEARIGICKESPAVWEAAEIATEPHSCNCIF